MVLKWHCLAWRVKITYWPILNPAVASLSSLRSLLYFRFSERGGFSEYYIFFTTNNTNTRSLIIHCELTIIFFAYYTVWDNLKYIT